MNACFPQAYKYTKQPYLGFELGVAESISYDDNITPQASQKKKKKIFQLYTRKRNIIRDTASLIFI